MSAERVERRLAAILAADVAGYSRLMERDEAGTLARLKALRRELIDPSIAEHKGPAGCARIADLLGMTEPRNLVALSRVIPRKSSVPHSREPRNTGPLFHP